jgi:hypothetical protein
MVERFKIKDIKDEVLNVVINEITRGEDGKFYLISEKSGNLDEMMNFMCNKEHKAFVKVKVDKLIEKLNSSTEEEINTIMNADFQEEVYNIL